MMITPAIYRDIPSSFMMNPMPMMPMMPMYGMYPSYGIAPMRPMLPNDKFEKLQSKKRETKGTVIATTIALAALTAVGLHFGKKYNIKMPDSIKTKFTSLKTKFGEICTKLKNVVKKK